MPQPYSNREPATQVPTFNRSYCTRYWLTGSVIACCICWCCCPCPVIYWLSTSIGRFSMRFLQATRHIAQRNLELCFPDMPAARPTPDALVVKFRIGRHGAVETGMAWFWPTGASAGSRSARSTSKGARQPAGRVADWPALFDAGAGRAHLRHSQPGIDVYRPHDNKLMDWLQTWGRMRSRNRCWIAKTSQRHDPRLKRGDIIWYAPDHDLRPAQRHFVPLFAVDKAATTTGSYVLVRMGKTRRSFRSPAPPAGRQRL
ncbi:lipid A biosynthesis lauroyl acyltransferase [Serratia ureilytica]